MVPARVAQALSPWLFGIALDRWGSGALAVSGALGALALVALFFLRATEEQAAASVIPAAPT